KEAIVLQDVQASQRILGRKRLPEPGLLGVKNGIRGGNQALAARRRAAEFPIDGELRRVGGGLESLEWRNVDVADRQVECGLDVLDGRWHWLGLSERIRLDLQSRDRLFWLFDVWQGLELGRRLDVRRRLPSRRGSGGRGGDCRWLELLELRPRCRPVSSLVEEQQPACVMLDRSLRGAGST